VTAIHTLTYPPTYTPSQTHCRTLYTLCISVSCRKFGDDHFIYTAPHVMHCTITCNTSLCHKHNAMHINNCYILTRLCSFLFHLRTHLQDNFYTDTYRHIHHQLSNITKNTSKLASLTRTHHTMSMQLLHKLSNTLTLLHDVHHNSFTNFKIIIIILILIVI